MKSINQWPNTLGHQLQYLNGQVFLKKNFSQFGEKKRKNESQFVSHKLIWFKQELNVGITMSDRVEWTQEKSSQNRIKISLL